MNGTYARVPTVDDDMGFDNVLQRIKTTPPKHFAIEEPKESRAVQTTRPNIHTLNKSKDGTAQTLVFKTGPPIPPLDPQFKAFEG